LLGVDNSLVVKLPIHPSSIEELALTRFWLLKLSQAYFEEVWACNGVILNPEFLSAINPKRGPRKIIFHANNVEIGVMFFEEIGLVEEMIPPALGPFICSRFLGLNSNLTGNECDDLIKFILGTTIMQEAVYIFTNGERDIGEFCELFVKV
jgi:hypothetical protein